MVFELDRLINLTRHCWVMRNLFAFQILDNYLVVGMRLILFFDHLIFYFFVFSFGHSVFFLFDFSFQLPYVSPGLPLPSVSSFSLLWRLTNLWTNNHKLRHQKVTRKRSHVEGSRDIRCNITCSQKESQESHFFIHFYSYQTELHTNSWFLN